MSDYIRRYTLRINGILLNKLEYIAKADGRTINKQLEYLVKKNIYEYEMEFGVITSELVKEMKKIIRGNM